MSRRFLSLFKRKFLNNNRRYNIVPQMKDYDSLEMDCPPYIMRFQAPNQKTKSFSTDKYGFRNTLNINKNSKRLGIAIGGSNVFGFGATSDNTTIPSFLTKLTGFQWLNYGGCAFNSFQEIFLFMMFPPKNVTDIVLLTGLNTIYNNNVPQNNWNEYPHFYYQSEYVNIIKNGFENTNLSSNISHLKKVNEENAVKRSKDELNIILNFWTAFCRKMHINIMVVLQPTVYTLNKKLSKEEKELFQILDKIQNILAWKYVKIITNQFPKISSHLNKLQKDLKFNFLDLNNCKKLKTNEWLFVDRVHQTDKGNLIIANSIKDTITR